jgi:Zn-finger nucleic acid-binding protein
MRSAEQLAAMSCPVCRVPLAMSDRQGIEIDYCPQCRGVWLDRGELDKIIERSAPQPAATMQQAPAQQPTAAPPPQQVYVQQPWSGKPHYGHKKRKSWLEEIFD